MTAPIEPEVPISPTLGEYLAVIHTDATDLRAEVRHAEEVRRKTNLIGLILLIILAGLMLAVLAVARKTNVIASQSRQTNARISDCTTPGGTCYTEGSHRTGDAIGSILRAQIALGECSRQFPAESGPAFDAKLRACVYQRIATDPGPPAPPAHSPAQSPAPSPAPTKR